MREVGLCSSPVAWTGIILIPEGVPYSYHVARDKPDLVRLIFSTCVRLPSPHCFKSRKYLGSLVKHLT